MVSTGMPKMEKSSGCLVRSPVAVLSAATWIKQADYPVDDSAGQQRSHTADPRSAALRVIGTAEVHRALKNSKMLALEAPSHRGRGRAPGVGPRGPQSIGQRPRKRTKRFPASARGPSRKRSSAGLRLGALCGVPRRRPAETDPLAPSSFARCFHSVPQWAPAPIVGVELPGDRIRTHTGGVFKIKKRRAGLHRGQQARSSARRRPFERPDGSRAGCRFRRSLQVCRLPRRLFKPMLDVDPHPQVIFVQREEIRLSCR
jgi:hypothetical protein